MNAIQASLFQDFAIMMPRGATQKRGPATARTDEEPARQPLAARVGIGIGIGIGIENEGENMVDPDPEER
jgi:hypothetical protein